MLCEFDISMRVTGDGMMGSNIEYKPYIMTHGTFGAHKVKERVDLQLVETRKREFSENNNTTPIQQQQQQEELYQYDNQVNTYKSARAVNYKLGFKDANATRIDEAVNVELWCHTRLSGIKELDKREAQYVERQVSMGLFQLDVAQLMRLFKGENQGRLDHPFTLDASVVDDKIIDAYVQDLARRELRADSQMTSELYNSYLRRAIEVTRKGMVQFEITMRQFREDLYVGSVYHVDDFQLKTCLASFTSTEGSRTPKTIGQHYSHLPHSRTARPSDRNTRRGPLDPPAPVIIYTPEGQDFTPWSHTSALGMEKMMDCLQHCVLATYCHTFMKLDQRDPEPLYGPVDQVVKNLHFPQWISKMGKGPAISYFACHDPTTRVYSSEQAKLEDLHRYGFTAKTEKHMLMMLNAALRGRGLDHKTFEAEVRNHFSTKNRSRVPTGLFMLCEEVIARLGTFAANSAYYTSDYRMVRTLALGNVAKMIVLDSWDNTILNNSGRSDDCEGQDNTATTIIRAFGTGRHELGFKWDSSLLNAVQLYLSHTVIYDVGGTVTSAFVDTGNQPTDLHKSDLPMNDDAMDLRSKSDGHCFGIMESLSNCIKRVAQGNMGRNKGIMQRLNAASIADDAFQARDALRQGMILEGTGTMEPRILPLDESYGRGVGGHDTIKLRDKKLAERSFVKALYAHMQTLKDMDKKDGGTRSAVSNIFNGEGMQHYVKQQHPQRRISDFYKQPVMACCNELYQRFGIAASQFAFTQRSPGSDELRYGVRIADFLRNTAGYPLVFPFADCTQEWQQQVNQLTECVQHQLPLMAFGRYTDEQYEKETHSRYMGGSLADQKSFEALVHAVAADPTLTVARLQSRPWKLDSDPTKTRELYDMLGDQKVAPGVVAYAFYSEHQLPVCGPTVEILVVGKVDVWMGLMQPGSL